MYIQNLKNIDLDDLVFCLLMSFENYFLTMPTETIYWQNRFQSARVDYELSFGMFDGANLVGFIINGVDDYHNKKTAFNTGTGVVPPHRGKQLVDKLYAHALPLFKEQAIQIAALEVIQDNARAIRVYERIGFQKTKNYLCFNGKLASSKQLVSLHPFDFPLKENPYSNFYAWDNCNNAILSSPQNTYKSYSVKDANQETIGFFTINPVTGYLPQFEALQPAPQNWNLLFDGIAQVSTTIKINNIDTLRVDLIQAIRSLGLKNTVNQFEMQVDINHFF